MSRPYYPVSRYTRRQYRAQAAMLRLLAGAVLAGLLALALLASDLAHAAQPLVRFDGGIGSQPLASGGIVNGVQQVATNNVFDVNPGGRPWVIERLVASVDVNGNAKVDGRGLLLAGGNAVGRNGGQSVRAVLICNNGATKHQTALTPLADNGDFSFNEPLSPPVPIPCATPVLLIVNANGAWFAAGIPKD